MSADASLEQQWDRIRSRLKDEVGEVAYRSWLQPLTVADLKNGEVRILVPTRFMRDWVNTHYVDRIRMLWSAENGAVQSVDVVVASTPPLLASSDAARAE